MYLTTYVLFILVKSELTKVCVAMGRKRQLSASNSGGDSSNDEETVIGDDDCLDDEQDFVW